MINLLPNLWTKAWQHFRERKREEWDRSLPLDEIMHDRSEYAKYLGFGEGTTCYHNVYIYGNVQVGRNTWIGPGVILAGSGGIEIGNNCSISAGAQIYSHSSVQWAVSAGIENRRVGRTIIGNNVYLGPYAVIAMGSVIGDGAQVGAHSFIDGIVMPGEKIHPVKMVRSFA